jgi:hypothetical protein
MPVPHRKLTVVALMAACLSSAVALRLRAAHDPAAAQDAGAQTAAAQAAGAASGGRYFEMRTYHVAEGKLEALHNRFRQHTNRLFKKHGIDMVGYWTVSAKPGEAAKDTLVFILGYPSREEHDKRWNAFANDPEWVKAKNESERNGPLVEKVEQQFLAPTDYSPVK